MAGEDYLKVAAANIRRAAQAKQQEVRELQAEITRQHHDIDHEIDKLTTEKNHRQSLAASSQTDGIMRARLMKEVNDHQKLIDSKHHQKRQLEDEIKRQIDQREGQIHNLLNNAASFEGQWGV